MPTYGYMGGGTFYLLRGGRSRGRRKFIFPAANEAEAPSQSVSELESRGGSSGVRRQVELAFAVFVTDAIFQAWRELVVLGTCSEVVRGCLKEQDRVLRTEVYEEFVMLHVEREVNKLRDKTSSSSSIKRAVLSWCERLAVEMFVADVRRVVDPGALHDLRGLLRGFEAPRHGFE